MKPIPLLLTLALCWCPLALHAQNAASPRYIPFQAQVTNQLGQLVDDGQYSVIFNLYDTAVGGQPVWSERHVKIGVTGGALNVFLGSISKFDNVPDGFFSTAKYLGITVDVDGLASTAEPEMVPRSVIIPAFHAKTAEEASKLAGQDWSSILVGGSNDPITGEIQAAKIETNGLTAAQLGTNSVGADEISDGAVTTGELADGTITRADLSTDLLQAIVPAGTILPFAGAATTVPAGWLLCDGSPVESAGYPNLFSAIGTAWGDASDDGLTETDFRVPDLRGIFLRGVDDSPISGSSGKDLNRDSRVPGTVGGNSGNLVGSYQPSLLPNHIHRWSVGAGPSTLNSWDLGGNYVAASVNDGTGGQGTTNGSTADNWTNFLGRSNYTDPTTGSHGTSGQVAPPNAYVNYIIKY